MTMSEKGKRKEMGEKTWMDEELEDTLHVNERGAWYEKQSPCDGQTDVNNEQQRDKDGLPHPWKETKLSVPATQESNTSINLKND